MGGETESAERKDVVEDDFTRVLKKAERNGEVKDEVLGGLRGGEVYSVVGNVGSSRVSSSGTAPLWKL